MVPRLVGLRESFSLPETSPAPKLLSLIIDRCGKAFMSMVVVHHPGVSFAGFKMSSDAQTSFMSCCLLLPVSLSNVNPTLMSNGAFILSSGQSLFGLDRIMNSPSPSPQSINGLSRSILQYTQSL